MYAVKEFEYNNPEVLQGWLNQQSEQGLMLVSVSGKCFIFMVTGVIIGGARISMDASAYFDPSLMN